MSDIRLVIVASHPVQYQVPLFRELAKHCKMLVLFAHRASGKDQAAAGFRVSFEWDIDLTSGFDHAFLHNVAKNPGLKLFAGCDTPEIKNILRRTKPNCVLLMGWHLKCYWQAIWGCKLASIPVMVRGDSHLDTPRSGFKRACKALIYPVALRVFDAALFVGEKSRRYWTHYGYPKERMFFSPHCVDNIWFSSRATAQARLELRGQLGIKDGTFLVLFAGKLETIKRVSDVIEAVARCRADGRSIEILIAGSGALERTLKLQADERKVPLHILGFCNQTQMPAAYAAADSLVLASESETWGLVANEALACGKAVIVSDKCGCAADIATDGAAGKIFKCGDIGELTRVLLNTIADPPGLNAIAEMSNQYSVAAAASGVLEAVRELEVLTRVKKKHLRS